MAKPTKEEVANAVEEITTPKYTKEELLAIFDSILFEGEYREEFKIKGKLAVTFRTRTADETSFITNEVDTKSFNLVSSLQEYRALLNIASSLVIYNTKDLSSLSLDERRAFVGKLPSVVAAAISNSLVEFDQKTDAALREGEENF
jgi:hypothetical protein